MHATSHIADASGTSPDADGLWGPLADKRTHCNTAWTAVKMLRDVTNIYRGSGTAAAQSEPNVGGTANRDTTAPSTARLKYPLLLPSVSNRDNSKRRVLQGGSAGAVKTLKRVAAAVPKVLPVLDDDWLPPDSAEDDAAEAAAACCAAAEAPGRRQLRQRRPVNTTNAGGTPPPPPPSLRASPTHCTAGDGEPMTTLPLRASQPAASSLLHFSGSGGALQQRQQQFDLRTLAGYQPRASGSAATSCSALDKLMRACEGGSGSAGCEQQRRQQKGIPTMQELLLARFGGSGGGSDIDPAAAAASAAAAIQAVKVGEGTYSEVFAITPAASAAVHDGSAAAGRGIGSRHQQGRQQPSRRPTAAPMSQQHTSSAVVILKIVPIDGQQRYNNAPQKSAADVLGEVRVSHALSDLGRHDFSLDSGGELLSGGGSGRPGPAAWLYSNNHALYSSSGGGSDVLVNSAAAGGNVGLNATTAFVRTHWTAVCRGPFAPMLVDAWRRHADSAAPGEAENDAPSSLPDQQLYVVFAMDAAGRDLEGSVLRGYDQVRSVLAQVRTVYLPVYVLRAKERVCTVPVAEASVRLLKQRDGYFILWMSLSLIHLCCH